jgi:hypothetical protein
VSPTNPPSLQQGLLLTEVLFAPVEGEPGFVEISNAGSAAIDTAGAILRLGVMDLSLGGLAEPLAPGKQVLVLLDGKHVTDGTVIHAGNGVGLDPKTDVVKLLDRDGRTLDRVAWGAAQPFGVPLGPGGIVPDALEPGTTIGRAPGATQRGQPYDWVLYAGADGSPGRQNPMPTVGVLLPMSGAVIDRTQASLAWYPVPGAVAYRVQVASDPTFASTLIDTRTTELQVDGSSLVPGEYSWRVLAQAADGTASRFSEPSTFELRSTTALAPVAAGAPIAAAGAFLLVADDPGTQLAVPLLSQHKDTSMLLLERNVESGAHAWDVDHGVLDPLDPADNKNCAIASTAMVNHFFGGDISQDRIGYELFKGSQDGPEWDLPYGRGINENQVTAALTFALGAAPTRMRPGMTPDEVWAAVTTSLRAGRPVVAANLHHTIVFTGYQVANGKRLFSVNDPWNYAGRSGTSQYNVDANNGRSVAVLDLWLPPAGAVGRHDEPSIRTDSDGDGVVDFDETERFKTNPNNKDTDGDKLPDKQDIVTGVFDPTYGYALDPQSNSAGRDFDGDGIPTELDPDSDNGGCPDGVEDTNLNGHRDSGETSNFDVSDDACQTPGLTGTLTWHEDSVVSDTGGRSEHHASMTISVRMMPAPPDPNVVPGGFVDAGSTYTYTGSGAYTVTEGCGIEQQWTEQGGGALTQDHALISAGLTGDRLDLAVWGPFTISGSMTLTCQNDTEPLDPGKPGDHLGIPECADVQAGTTGLEGIEVADSKPRRFDFTCTQKGVVGDSTIALSGVLTLAP